MRIRGYEEGIFTILQNSIAAAGEKMGNMVRGVADIGNSVVAGISDAMEGVSNIAQGFSLGSSSAPEPTREPEKLGGNARKQEMLAASAAGEVDRYTVTMNDIQAPIVAPSAQYQQQRQAGGMGGVG